MHSTRITLLKLIPFSNWLFIYSGADSLFTHAQERETWLSCTVSPRLY